MFRVVLGYKFQQSIEKEDLQISRNGSRRISVNFHKDSYILLERNEVYFEFIQLLEEPTNIE